MAFRLSESSIKDAIDHLCRFGDTDVFPHLQELTFFHDECENIADKLHTLDLDSYDPSGAIEALAPKSRYGFRIAHQLGVIDTVLLLAAVVEIGDNLEALRPISTGVEAFSYRFKRDVNGTLFLNNHTYKDWLHAQQERVQSSLRIKNIIVTDISDFYARISFHRLENLLDEAVQNHGAARYIKKVIRKIKVKQSFGLPVGGSASRILAELALSDIDKALVDAEISASRFVDDFRIFLEADEEPYKVLSVLAQLLGIGEGLTLNSAKTNVLSRVQFLEKMKYMTSDVTQEAESDALETLTASIYFDDTPDYDDVEKLKSLNLLGYLQMELDKEYYDMGRIKVIFRALKIARPVEAIKYIRENLSELTIFAKEVTLLMQVLEEDECGCFDTLTDTVIAEILKPAVSNVQWIRTWLLELFVRGVVPITARKLSKIENLPSVLDKRQLHLIRGRIGNKSFFRVNKGNIDQMSKFERPAFVLGAVCLPKDEFENWLGMLGPIFSSDTEQLFLKWVKKHKSDVIRKVTR